MNKRGLTAINIVIALIIGGLVLAATILLFNSAQIPRYLEILLPDFSTRDTDIDRGMIDRTFLNEDGRCKPFAGKDKGSYSLNNGELEIWNGESWSNVEASVANDAKFKNRQIKNSIVDAESNMFFILNDQQDVFLTRTGIATVSEGTTFDYYPIGNLRSVTPKLEIIYVSGEYQLDDSRKSLFEAVLEGLKDSLDNQGAVIFSQEYALELYVPQGTGNAILYSDFENAQYGIDFEENFYFSTNIIDGFIFGSEDPWRNIDDETASDLEFLNRQIKDGLVVECSKE